MATAIVPEVNNGLSTDSLSCSLCGGVTASFSCDDCDLMIFCPSCEEMYHRHPKRKFHLRKSIVPTTPPNKQLNLSTVMMPSPMKPVISNFLGNNTTVNNDQHHQQQWSIGHPSNMPVPPPRKKKSLTSLLSRSSESPPVEHEFQQIRKNLISRPTPPVTSFTSSTPNILTSLRTTAQSIDPNTTFVQDISGIRLADPSHPMTGMCGSAAELTNPSTSGIGNGGDLSYRTEGSKKTPSLRGRRMASLSRKNNSLQDLRHGDFSFPHAFGVAPQNYPYVQQVPPPIQYQYLSYPYNNLPVPPPPPVHSWEFYQSFEDDINMPAEESSSASGEEDGEIEGDEDLQEPVGTSQDSLGNFNGGRRAMSAYPPHFLPSSSPWGGAYTMRPPPPPLPPLAYPPVYYGPYGYPVYPYYPHPASYVPSMTSSPPASICSTSHRRTRGRGSVEDFSTASSQPLDGRNRSRSRNGTTSHRSRKDSLDRINYGKVTGRKSSRTRTSNRSLNSSQCASDFSETDVSHTFDVQGGKNDKQPKMDDTNNNSSSEGDGNDKWTCQYCTFQNSAGRLVCEVCCKSRKSTTSENQRSVKELGCESKPRRPSLTSKVAAELGVSENLVREQIEIEKEMKRRRDNEARVEKENRRLEKLQRKLKERSEQECYHKKDLDLEGFEPPLEDIEASSRGNALPEPVTGARPKKRLHEATEKQREVRNGNETTGSSSISSESSRYQSTSDTPPSRERETARPGQPKESFIVSVRVEEKPSSSRGSRESRQKEFEAIESLINSLVNAKIDLSLVEQVINTALANRTNSSTHDSSSVSTSSHPSSTDSSSNRTGKEECENRSARQQEPKVTGKRTPASSSIPDQATRTSSEEQTPKTSGQASSSKEFNLRKEDSSSKAVLPSSDANEHLMSVKQDVNQQQLTATLAALQQLQLQQQQSPLPFNPYQAFMTSPLIDPNLMLMQMSMLNTNRSLLQQLLLLEKVVTKNEEEHKKEPQTQQERVSVVEPSLKVSGEKPSPREDEPFQVSVEKCRVQQDPVSTTNTIKLAEDILLELASDEELEDVDERDFDIIAGDEKTNHIDTIEADPIDITLPPLLAQETKLGLLSKSLLSLPSLSNSSSLTDISHGWKKLYECELCTGRFEIQDMVSLLACEHRACSSCMKQYLTIEIRERPRVIIQCPFCPEPTFEEEDEEGISNYLALLDQLVKSLLPPETHALFERKVRDRVLMKDENFRWCPKCSSGFIAASEKCTTTVCPDCQTLLCIKCNQPWESGHPSNCDNLRGRFRNPLGIQDPLLSKHLSEFGIDCPRCHFHYELSRGGCMHFHCVQCGYDFCGGCQKQFLSGTTCKVSPYCAKLGLHAHHPRNCLFYLRDKEPEALKKLLDKHGVSYQIPTTMNTGQRCSSCPIMEQKRHGNGYKDSICGRSVEYSPLCRTHYIEFLGQLIMKNNIDPIDMFENYELELVLKRNNITAPEKEKDEKEDRKTLIDLIKRECPLSK